ncbi:MAG TPA: DUF3570 domain-containing protein [Burkholderiaceae bacterium]|nr:DUF3570 domain-containing protein [Burkholderiaceae bacterium]
MAAIERKRSDSAGAIIAAALALPGVVAHADSAPENGVVALRYLGYQDSQPGLDRISVKAPSIYVLAPLSPQWAIDGTLVSDSVSGATPRYHTAISGATPRMSDERIAGTVQVTRYFDRANVSVGLATSSENDYNSNAGSINANFSSDDNNRTWNIGLGYASDKIGSTNDPTLHETRHTAELLVGVTQAWTANDLLQLNLTLARGRGFFSDPYKEVDNRPRERDQTIVLARWNHFAESTGGALRTAYRWYHDSFGINAHTFGAEWVQPFGRFVVTPSLRYYTQSAASFYFDPIYDPDVGAPYPPGYFTNPPPYSSADQRLAAFGAVTLGLAVAVNLGPDWIVGLKAERYEQRTSWRLGGNGSIGLDPFQATWFQIGLEKRF